MYKLTLLGLVMRISDRAIVPDDPRNADRVAYEQWLAAGNTPLPVDKPDPVAGIDAQLAALDRATLAGVRGLREFIIVQAQVTDALIAAGALPGATPLGDNVGIIKIRELEARAAALRAQRKEITG